MHVRELTRRLRTLSPEYGWKREMTEHLFSIFRIVGNGTEIADEANGSNCVENRTVVLQWPARSNHRRLCCEPPRPLSHFQQRRSISSSPWRSNGISSRAAVATTPVQIMDYQTAVRNGVRSTYTDKSVLAKKKVIRMLFVIVLEFFVCWAPLYVVNTWYVYDPNGLYTHVGSTEVALIQLLAYMSSCCNPITYCFMNEKFRNGFLNAFGCRRRHRRHGPARSTDLMSASFNDSINLGRRSFRGNSNCSPRYWPSFHQWLSECRRPAPAPTDETPFAQLQPCLPMRPIIFGAPMNIPKSSSPHSTLWLGVYQTVPLTRRR